MIQSKSVLPRRKAKAILNTTNVTDADRAMYDGPLKKFFKVQKNAILECARFNRASGKC